MKASYSKTAIVIGGTSGIGQGIAKRLSGKGYKVTVVTTSDNVPMMSMGSSWLAN